VAAAVARRILAGIMSIDVADLVAGWDGPRDVRVVFTRNRSVLVSCRRRPRRRDGAGEPRVVRLHEIFRDAPRDVRVAALATVLRHVPPAELASLRRLFREYVHAEDARFRSLSRPSTFARRAPGPKGDRHDLGAVLASLLASGIARPHRGDLVLTWTPRAQRRLLGTYEPAGGTDPAIIRINRALDDDAVPEALVGYVLHHELLHGEMPSTILDGRRRVHPPEFRRREREFPGWRDLEAWEREHFARIFRNRRRRERAGAARATLARRSAAAVAPSSAPSGRRLVLPPAPGRRGPAR
jgi:hypothetical protein